MASLIWLASQADGVQSRAAARLRSQMYSEAVTLAPTVKSRGFRERGRPRRFLVNRYSSGLSDLAVCMLAFLFCARG
jgi:hypothetical protein